MKEYRFLKLLDKFKGIYSKFGVDYEKMRLILSVKLTLDGRRTSTIMKNSKKNKEESKDTFILSLLVYAFFGLFIGLINMMSVNKMYLCSISFGIFMFMVVTTFISDFANVLLDVRDKNIIGTKGIDNKTINAAKITHIFYYIFLISLALSWLSVATMFRFGVLIGLLYLLELIVIDILMVVVTALIYLVILKYFDGEKVKDIINLIQILLTITMTVGYQLIGRMFNIADMNLVYNSSVWNLLIPPMWFAAPLYAIDGGEIDSIIITLIVLAFLVPIIALTLYIKNTSKFEESLTKLSIEKNQEKEKRNGLLYKLGRRMCKNNEQRASYDLSLSIMKREREFKAMAYPNFAMLMIFPVLFLFVFSGAFNNRIGNMSTSSALNIYFFALFIPTVFYTLKYSNNYKAAWIYESTYIKDMANINKGAYKALFINILLPIYLVDSIIIFVIIGIESLPILISAFMLNLIQIVIIHNIGKMDIPFTEKFGAMDQGESLPCVLLCMFITGLVAGLNAAALMNMYIFILYPILITILALFSWKKGITSKNK